jgi:hypothetical protein
MLLPASIRRAFHILRARALAVFGDAPMLFFAVVIGVAFTFRVVVGVVRDAKVPPVVAPTFATGPEPGLPSMAEQAEPAKAAAAAPASAPSVEVGAAARVQPFGSPPPARVAPKPRGRGRKPNR